MGLLALLSPLVLASTVANTAPSCTEITGWEQILARDETRWIVIGETHGSNEVPELFTDAVCLTAQSRRVVVGVEQPAMNQEAIDAFLASDGEEAAQRAFLDATMWNQPMKDGRSSESMFRLFEKLRQMKAAGIIEDVVAFQPTAFTSRPTPAEVERAMAEILLSAAGADETVVALVGNVHAMRTEVPFQGGYMAMAANLPEGETITLNVIGNGGEYWNCMRDRCGAHPVPSPPQAFKRGVDLSPDDAGPYSGVIYLGAPTTASPPQGRP